MMSSNKSKSQKKTDIKREESEVMLVGLNHDDNISGHHRAELTPCKPIIGYHSCIYDVLKVLHYTIYYNGSVFGIKTILFYF